MEAIKQNLMSNQYRKWQKVFRRLGTQTLSVNSTGFPNADEILTSRSYCDDVPQWLLEAAEAAAKGKSQLGTNHVRLAYVNFNKVFWNDEKPKNCLFLCLNELRIPFSAFIAEDVIRHVEYPPLTEECIGTQPQIIRRQSIASNTSGMAWSYYPDTNTTVGVVWAVDAEGRWEIDYILREAIQPHSYLLHQFLLPVLGLQAMTISMQHWLRSEKLQVTRAQLASGFHRYQRAKPGKPMENMDFTALSAELSGLAANILTSEMCLQGLQDLASSIISANMDNTAPRDIKDGHTGKRARYIDLQTSYWARECAFLQHEAVAWRRKARIVVQGIFNLIAQRDQIVNRDIARSSQSVAEQTGDVAVESKRIAEETRRDSASMKAIAAVTMFFLPGTFVASLFAMPVFQFDPGTTSITTHYFWLYWAVTVPLTIITLTTGVIWSRWANQPRGSSRVSFKHFQRFLDG